MKKWLRPSSVRIRLAFWFAGTLSAILIIFTAGVYSWLKHDLVSHVDKQLYEDFEASEDKLKFLPDGKLVWSGTYEHAEDEQEKDLGRWIDVWSSKGELLYSNKPGGLKNDFLVEACPKSNRFYDTIEIPKLGAVRILCDDQKIRETQTVIRVTRSLQAVNGSLNALLLILFVSLPVAITLSAFGGYALSRRVLSPIEKMATRAKLITADRLEERLPVENSEDELGRLAITFNDTFARLERSFEQMRRFSADASHELRTPLTAIRSVGEVYLSYKSPDKKGIETVSSMLEEAARMQRLIDTLLTLARADANQIARNATVEDLKELSESAVKHLEVLAEEKKQKLIFHGKTVKAEIDPVILRQAIINLIDNAIKYSPQGSSIAINVTQNQNQAIIEVRDEGPGISQEHLAHIFDRFYRVDKSRTRSQGSFGLGLSIAKWAVEMNNGKLDATSQVNSGSIFRISLPLEKGTA